MSFIRPNEAPRYESTTRQPSWTRYCAYSDAESPPPMMRTSAFFSGTDVTSNVIRPFNAEGSVQSGFCGRPRMPIAIAHVFDRYVAFDVSTRKNPSRGRMALTPSSYFTASRFSAIARSRYVSVSPFVRSVMQRTPVHTAARPL